MIMKMKFLAVLTMSVLMMGMAEMATAFEEYHYDASVVPNAASLPDGSRMFYTEVVGGTYWTVSDGKLTMNTAARKPIFFANAEWKSSLNWKIGSSNEGNSVSVRAKLSDNLSEDWGFYVIDGSYIASMTFFPGELKVKLMENDEVKIKSYSIDTLEFHTYSFSLCNGLVTYYVDGQSVFSGTAPSYSTSKKGIVIGDGAGVSRNPGGTGSFVVDDVVIRTKLQSIIASLN